VVSTWIAGRESATTSIDILAMWNSTVSTNGAMNGAGIGTGYSFGGGSHGSEFL
jgi:hypothetical protein